MALFCYQFFLDIEDFKIRLSIGPN